MPIRVLLVDDHQMLREGVADLLTQSGAFEVVAQADNGRIALQLTAEHLPDIVVSDITMPELNGIDLAAQIHTLNPDIKVVLVSMHASPDRVREALDAQVYGYLLKSDSSEELLIALKNVHDGKKYFSQSLPKPGRDSANLLSPRERETLQLLAEGRNIKEIAALLRISHKTAETHRSHIMSKLNLYSVAELTQYAVQHGITKI